METVPCEGVVDGIAETLGPSVFSLMALVVEGTVGTDTSALNVGKTLPVVVRTKFFTPPDVVVDALVASVAAVVGSVLKCKCITLQATHKEGVIA